MKHTLEVDSIILEFDTKRVLQDVFIKNTTGETCGILGRNGVGKSCLMNIVYGVLETANKSVRIDGVTNYNGFRNPNIIRYLPQFNFIPKNLRIKRVFNDFELNFDNFTSLFPDLEKFYNTKLHNLSGGERRIIEIFTILASKTKFCMLDEPFSQIMPVHVDTIKQLINKEKENKGIIITDHMYEHIIDICDNKYVIANGKTYLANNKTDLAKLGYINSNNAI